MRSALDGVEVARETRQQLADVADQLCELRLRSRWGVAVEDLVPELASPVNPPEQRSNLFAEHGRCALDRGPVVARLAGKAISGMREYADAGAKPGLVRDGHRAIAIHSPDDVAGKRYVGA